MRIRDKVPGLCVLACVMIGVTLAYRDELFPGASTELGATTLHWITGIGGGLMGLGAFVVGVSVVRLVSRPL
jgi:hypothetical protein